MDNLTTLIANAEEADDRADHMDDLYLAGEISREIYQAATLNAHIATQAVIVALSDTDWID